MFSERQYFGAMFVGQSAGWRRSNIDPVQAEITKLESAGKHNRASAAKALMLEAELVAMRDGFHEAHPILVAAREICGLEPSGTHRELGERILRGKYGDWQSAATGAAPTVPQTIAPGVSAADLMQVSLHEATHAAVAMFCSLRVESALARPDGSGQCVYFHDETGHEYDEVLISLSALHRSQMCGRDPGGIGSDLRHLADAVKRRTGRDVDVANILHDDEVFRAKMLLDGLLSEKLSPVIGRMARVIFDASPNAVSGEVLTEIYREHEYEESLQK